MREVGEVPLVVLMDLDQAFIRYEVERRQHCENARPDHKADAECHHRQDHVEHSVKHQVGNREVLVTPKYTLTSIVIEFASFRVASKLSKKYRLMMCR